MLYYKVNIRDMVMVADLAFACFLPFDVFVKSKEPINKANSSNHCPLTTGAFLIKELMTCLEGLIAESETETARPEPSPRRGPRARSS